MSETNIRNEHVSENDRTAVERLRKMSRRSFFVLGVGAAAGLGGWQWLGTRSKLGSVPYPLRWTLQFNERLANGYFKEGRLAPTFPAEMAREPRVNGGEGMTADFDSAEWCMQVMSAGESRTFTLADIRRLPRVEMTTEHKCIEGWSVIVNWAGARFSDFAEQYKLGTRDGTRPDVAKRPNDLVRYVGLETPDAGYYVGMDMPSALHPQTLLCYEMGREPLPAEHGAPLRLVTTVKYGIKSIKRVGRITFTDNRPRDFWAEQGYDWYSGL